MPIIESNIKSAKVEISFEDFTTIIKLNDTKIEGVKGLYLNCQPDSSPSILLDILPKKLKLNSNDKELDELSANDLIKEITKRMTGNFK